MSDGLGAGFGALLLLTVLVAVAGLLVATAAAAVLLADRRASVPAALRYAAVGLVGIVVAVAGFAVLALADEAPPAAVLFLVVVGLPLALVAGRTRLAGSSWVDVVAASGLAWSGPFLVGVGVLFVLTTQTGTSTAAITAAVGLVTTGGALLAGEYARTLVGEDPPAEASARAGSG